MDKMVVFFLIIIFIYFVFSFIKSKKNKGEKTVFYKEKENEKLREVFEKQIMVQQDNNHITPVIAAAVASVMGDRSFKIKKIEVKPETTQYYSAWKMAGRQSGMLKLTRASNQ